MNSSSMLRLMLACLLLCPSVVHGQIGELNENSVAGYTADFKQADADGDGVLRKDELDPYVASFPEPMRELLRRRQADGTYGVNLEQVLEAANQAKRLLGYDPRSEQKFLRTFGRLDADSDGKLTDQELRLAPPEMRGFLSVPDGTDGMDQTEFLQRMGGFVRATEFRRTTETNRWKTQQREEEQLHRNVAQLMAAAQGSDQAEDEIIEKEIRLGGGGEGVPLPGELERRLRNDATRFPAERVLGQGPRGAGAESPPDQRPEVYKVLFNSADQNGDGRLTGQEVDRLPRQLREILTERLKADREAGMTLEQVRDGFAILLEESATRRAEQLERQREEPQLGEDSGKFVEGATQEQAGNPPPPDRAITVQIVLLGRFSEEVPVRTLGAEVLTAIGDSEGEVPSSLVGRLLPWGGAEENSAVKILDAMQGGTVAGDQVRLQTGTQPTGTMATLQASVDGNEVWVKAEFEKSFLPQARRSNSAPVPGATPGAMPAGYGGMSSYPVVPATSTLRATGTVRVTPGRPVILTEVLQQSENGVQEYVVLVDAAIESD